MRREEIKEKDATGATERGRSPSGVAPAAEGSGGPGRPGFDPGAVRRWSVQRKQEVALRLLRGEPVDALSRELGVEIYRLEQWRRKALLGMEEALRERVGDPLNTELDQALKRIGELSMENELLRMRCEKKGPFPNRRLR
jgi:transposase-like protein